jgi:Clostripain family.
MAWNVLIYMVADDAFGVFTNDSIEAELAAMENAVDQHPETTVIVRADTRDSTGFRARAIHGRLKRHNLEVEPVAGRNDIENFLSERVSKTDQNLVLFWGHGFGPAGLHYERQFVDPIKLSGAIRDAFGDRAIDLLVLMSCHMSTIELACELAARSLPLPERTRAANFIVASQGLVQPSPEQPFPYADLFGMLKTTATPKEVGQALVDKLGTDLFKAPFSLLDVSATTGVVDALSDIAHVLTERGNPFQTNHAHLSPSLLDLHNAFEEARTDEFALVDLGRLGRRLAAMEPSAKDDAEDAKSREEARDAGRRLVNALKDHFVVQPGPEGTHPRKFTGVSAFCPPHHEETDPSRLSTIRRVVLKADYRKLSLSQSISGHSWQEVVDLTNRDAVLASHQG